MAIDPLRKRPGKERPEIWASGGQRPPFDLRALWRATVHLARDGIAPLHAWAARGLRRAAVNVKAGKGRIPAGKLGKAERFVPSHLRVAGWLKNVAATLSHASATADPNVTRGNALVAEIEPHLWDDGDSATPSAKASPTQSDAPEPALPDAGPVPDVAPVVLAEPERAEADPLASIRDEMSGARKPTASSGARAPSTARPPAPPGPVATGVIQVAGYALGWASVALALPYGLARAMWLWGSGRDLKTIGRED